MFCLFLFLIVRPLFGLIHFRQTRFDLGGDGGGGWGRKPVSTLVVTQAGRGGRGRREGVAEGLGGSIRCQGDGVEKLVGSDA